VSHLAMLVFSAKGLYHSLYYLCMSFCSSGGGNLVRFTDADYYPMRGRHVTFFSWRDPN
jgi:hypothetical protein